MVAAISFAVEEQGHLLKVKTILVQNSQHDRKQYLLCFIGALI